MKSPATMDCRIQLLEMIERSFVMNYLTYFFLAPEYVNRRFSSSAVGNVDNIVMN